MKYLKYIFGTLGLIFCVFIYKDFIIPAIFSLFEIFLLLIELYKELEMPYLWFATAFLIVVGWYFLIQVIQITLNIFNLSIKPFYNRGRK